MREINTQLPISKEIADLKLRDFVVPLFRQKRVLIITAVSVFALAILYFAVTGLSYPSHMMILLNRERIDPLVSAQSTTPVITASDPITEEEINSEVELLSSRDVLEGVVTQNQLQIPRGFFAVLMDKLPWHTEDSRVARAVKGLAKKIKPEAVKDTNLIEVTYKSSDPQLSYNVLKSLADLYVAKHVSVHRPAGSFEFFASETDKYQAELKEAEDQLRKFGEKNAIAAPDEQRTQLATQVGTSVGLLHAAGEAAAADEERIKNDRLQMSKISPRATTVQASAYNDKLISDLSATLLAAELKRTQLALKYDPKYPLVQEADQEVAQAKEALGKAEQTKYVSESTDRDPTYELLREDAAKTEADLAAQRATVSATQRSIQSIQAQMVALDQLSLSQRDLQRQMKAAESNYLLYLGKREQERSSDALDITRISNVAIAIPPAVPVLPSVGWPLLL